MGEQNWKMITYLCAVCALFLFQFILYMNKVQSRESLKMNKSLAEYQVQNNS